MRTTAIILIWGAAAIGGLLLITAQAVAQSAQTACEPPG